MHVAGLDDRWGSPHFLHLRVLDITVICWGPPSRETVQQESHTILTSLTLSPALEHVRLVLQCFTATTPSTQDMESRDATTVADRAQYADLHAVLAHPIFSSLHRVTVVLSSIFQEGLVPAKDVALKRLDFLRALFAPWCVHGIANLACAISTNSRSWEVAVAKGKATRYIDLRGRDYDLATALRIAGLDP